MNSNKTIRIGNNKSPVIISENLQKDFKRWWQLRIGSHKTTPVLLLVDEIVYSHHRLLIENILKDLPVSLIETYPVLAGENCKQWAFAGQILSSWIDDSITKDTVVVCIGGGTLSDLGGFLAAVYKRGLRTVYIPTTLLSMTDAALGGKNAINFGASKNQIGTIRFPEFTLIAPQWLSSLPAREMKSGYAEMMKHALLSDHGFIKAILLITDTAVAPTLSMLMRSIRVKLKVVADDPFEKHERLWLNLGHSFGHAYESFFNASGKHISHGHAVAIGLAEALFFSVKSAGFPQVDADRITKWLKDQFCFDNLPDWNEIRTYIKKDKKNLSSGIRLVLLQSPGKPFIQQMDESDCSTLHAGFLNQMFQ